jgi:hypothetical protein
MARFRPLSYVPLAILMIATAAAAATSVATGPSDAAPLTWHNPGSQSLPPTSPSDPHKQLATDDAQQLLGLVTPDGDWGAVSSPPVPSLASPMSLPGTADLVDQYHLWTAPGTMAAVQAWMAAHPPTGSRQVGSGSSYQDGVLVESGVTYGYAPTANEFSSRQVAVSFAPLPRGRVGVRVDAQVVWYPSRPSDESVPSGTTRVTATVYTRDSLAGSTETVLGSRTFTDPAVVSLLARLVDSSPLTVPGARSCPADTGTGPQLDLVFAGPPGVPEVRVHDDTNGCGGISFSIGRTTLAPLTDTGLLRRVEQLMGLDLSRVYGG